LSDDREFKSLRENPTVPWSLEQVHPEFDTTSFIDPKASVIGHVRIGRSVYVAPFASIRGDEGHPIFIGDESNVQDGVVIHAHKVEFEMNIVEYRNEKYAVYIADRVSLSHLCHIHGPVLIDENTWIGMGSVIWRSTVGMNCVVLPRAVVMNVAIPDGMLVPAGAVIDTVEAAFVLEPVEKSAYKDLNMGIVEINKELARGYNSQKAFDVNWD
jgi:carbonic anhydrase/acetyltransferase-like protein (isoleucine patch superfamily)